jgi:hypothetical protein
MAPRKKILTPLRAIRAKCLDCSGYDKEEVDACELRDCPLYTFRTGVDPNAAVTAPKSLLKAVPEAQAADHPSEPDQKEPPQGTALPKTFVIRKPVPKKPERFGFLRLF